MMLAIEAPRPLLALETRAVADARRIRAAVRTVVAQLNQALQQLGKAIMQAARAVGSFVDQVAKLFQVPVAFLQRPGGAPYYWRDGKRRRNHAWFRERARIRRRIAKAARRG